MLQGDKLRLTITGLNNEGEGVVRTGGERFVLFVPDALPGEDVTVRIVQVKKNYGLAKVLERHCDSADRVEPLCPSFSRCGGCQLQHMKYEAQLRLKTQTVFDALTRIAGLSEPPVKNCLASPQQWGYRNKASLPAQIDRMENLKAGFYKKRSHDVVPFDRCPVLMPRLEKQLCRMLTLIKQEGLNGYNESSPNNNINFIRHIVARSSFYTDEALGGVVAKRYPNKSEKTALQNIAEKISVSSNGFILNINNREGNFIWGEKFDCLAGKAVMEERLANFRLQFELSSFFQVNSAQALALYNFAAKEALGRGAAHLLELYSGVGSLTSFLASGCEDVTAVESWQPAAKFILPNAKLNGLHNITARDGLAEDIVLQLTDKKFDTVVIDPPRTGCAPSVVNALLKISPAKIVYVSCNPATLARDAKILLADKYNLITAQPFDMFPQTGHVETVALMSRVEK